MNQLKCNQTPSLLASPILASPTPPGGEFLIQEVLYEEVDFISVPVISDDAGAENDDAFLDCGCAISERSLCTNGSHISCHSSDITCYLCEDAPSIGEKVLDHYYESLSESSYQTPRLFHSPGGRHQYQHKLRMEKFLIMGFKRNDANYVSVFEENWKDMTGARSVLLNLSADYGLEKIQFLKRVNLVSDNSFGAKKLASDANSFTHILIVTLKHVTRKNKVYLMDFIHRLRLRMLGSLALYGHSDAFDNTRDGSSICFTASTRSNSCTTTHSSVLPSRTRNHSLASSIRRKSSAGGRSDKSFGVLISPSSSTCCSSFDSRTSSSSSEISERRASIRSSIL